MIVRFFVVFLFGASFSIARTHDSILSATKHEYSDCITLLNEKTAGYKERYEEYERIVKLLENEKSVLSAAIEARDIKLSKMEELQETVRKLTKDVESKKVLAQDLVRIVEFAAKLCHILSLVVWSHDLMTVQVCCMCTFLYFSAPGKCSCN